MFCKKNKEPKEKRPWFFSSIKVYERLIKRLCSDIDKTLKKIEDVTGLSIDDIDLSTESKNIITYKEYLDKINDKKEDDDIEDGNEDDSQEELSYEEFLSNLKDTSDKLGEDDKEIISSHPICFCEDCINNCENDKCNCCYDDKISCTECMNLDCNCNENDIDWCDGCKFNGDVNSDDCDCDDNEKCETCTDMSCHCNPNYKNKMIEESVKKDVTNKIINTDSMDELFDTIENLSDKEKEILNNSTSEELIGNLESKKDSSIKEPEKKKNKYVIGDDAYKTISSINTTTTTDEMIEKANNLGLGFEYDGDCYLSKNGKIAFGVSNDTKYFDTMIIQSDLKLYPHLSNKVYNEICREIGLKPISQFKSLGLDGKCAVCEREDGYKYGINIKIFETKYMLLTINFSLNEEN